MEKVKAKLVKFKHWFITSITIIIVFLASLVAIPILFPPTPPTGQAPEIYYSGAGDGYTYYGGGDAQTWTTVHHATAGQTASYTATTIMMEAMESTEGAGWNMISRSFIPFNTSGLSDTAIIVSATLYIYVTATADGDNDGYDYLSVVQTTQASTSAIVLEDYDQCGTIHTSQKGAADIDITGLATGYMSIPLNDTGIGWINRTGWTMLGLREGHDVADHQIAANKDNYVQYSSSEVSGTSQDPYLSVTVLPPNTYPATTSDGYISQTAQNNYTAAQTNATGTVTNTTTTAFIGQNGTYTLSYDNVPDAQGDKEDWYEEPSSGAGTSWQVVDEVTPVTTDYIYDRVVGHYDLFSVQNFSESDWYAAGGVTVYIYAKMNSTTAGVKIMVKTGGTSYEGSEKTLTSSWTSYNTVWTTNPKTGVAWTTADLNSLQIGVNLTTYSGSVLYYAFVAAIYVKVYYKQYDIYRSFVFFDTSTLPRSPIVSAKLQLYCPSSGALVDNSFNVTVMNSTSGTYPHNPLQTSDYALSNYANNGGKSNASAWSTSSYNNITITNLSWIQLAGTTKFALISSRDISATKPPTTGSSDDSEYVTFNTQESTSNKPLLEVVVNIGNVSECFVYSFNATDTAWDIVGATPYLNNDTTNYILNADPTDNMSWFFFEATAKTPQQVYLYIEGRSLLQVTIFINNGISTSNYSVNFTSSIAFQTVNVTTDLGTATKLGSACMKIMGVSSANSYRRVIRAYLKVHSGAVPIAYGTTNKVAETYATLYCHWFAVQGLSTYAISYNNSGVYCTNITGALTGTDDWSNTSITVNSSSLYSVSVVFYANDSSNNWETATYTFYIVFADYSAANLVSLVGNVQQHSLGRNNFYCKNAQRYLVFWGNVTDENWYYVTSGDGVDWNVSGLVRSGGAVPYGKFYGWVEDRGGIDYVHYQFCTELINESWYWRRAQMLSNGTLAWDAVEQLVLNGTGFSGGTHAVEGLMTDELGHIFYQYDYQNATCIIANITICDWTNGTWHTKTGYPKVVWNHTGATYFDLMETALLRFPNGCYSIEAPSTGMNGKNLTYASDTFGAVEDLSDVPLGTTTRKFSFISNNGAIYGTFINSTFTGMYYSETVNGTSIVKDEFVTSNLDIESYPVIAYHESTSEIVLDWTQDRFVYMSLRNSTMWHNVSRLLELEGCYVITDPNQIIPYVASGTLFTFGVISDTNTSNYLLTYFYYPIPVTELVVGWNNFNPFSADVGKTLGQIDASLDADLINWSLITIDYGNGTQWSLVYGQTYNSDKLVASISDTFRIYCNVAGEWWHTYT